MPPMLKGELDLSGDTTPVPIPLGTLDECPLGPRHYTALEGPGDK